MSLRRQRLSAVPATASAPGSPAPAVPRRDFLARTAAAVGAGLLAFAARPALPGGDEAHAATAGLDPFIGEIILFAGNFAPSGYLSCDGQLMAIAQNTALFSILGTTFGGNGQTTFALPDLRGRAPIHMGAGPGLPVFQLGEQGGAADHTLLSNEMPAHSHVALADTGSGTQSSPAGGLPARDPSGSPAYGTNAVASLAGNAIGISGASQPHNNLPPFLTIHYCIAVQGIFPPRN